MAKIPLVTLYQFARHHAANAAAPIYERKGTASPSQLKSDFAAFAAQNGLKQYGKNVQESIKDRYETAWWRAAGRGFGTVTDKSNPDYREMHPGDRFQAELALKRELHSGEVSESREAEILSELKKIREASKPARASKKKKSDDDQFMSVMGGYALDMKQRGRLVGTVRPDGAVVDNFGKVIGHTKPWEPGKQSNPTFNKFGLQTKKLTLKAPLQLTDDHGYGPTLSAGEKVDVQLDVNSARHTDGSVKAWHNSGFRGMVSAFVKFTEGKKQFKNWPKDWPTGEEAGAQPNPRYTAYTRPEDGATPVGYQIERKGKTISGGWDLFDRTPVQTGDYVYVKYSDGGVLPYPEAQLKQNPYSDIQGVTLGDYTGFSGESVKRGKVYLLHEIGTGKGLAVKADYIYLSNGDEVTSLPTNVVGERVGTPIEIRATLVLSPAGSKRVKVDHESILVFELLQGYSAKERVRLRSARTYTSNPKSKRKEANPYTSVIQFTQSADNEKDANAMLGGLSSLDGYISGRVLPPGPGKPAWRIQAFFKDEGSIEGLEGARKVMAPDHMLKSNPAPYTYSQPTEERHRIATELLHHITEHLKTPGNVVQVAVHNGSRVYKSADNFKVGKDGLYTRRGKSWDYLVPGQFVIRFGAYKSNPETAADSFYATFHGTEPTEVLEVIEDVVEHDHLTSLGQLRELVIHTESGYKLEKTWEEDRNGSDSDIPFLCSSEDGTQLYIRGGNQSIDLDKVKMGPGTKWFKEKVMVGEIHLITYRTRKSFDKFKDIDYFHKLGEETKVRPYLVYDTRSELLEVVGGQYHIDNPLIGTSRGIIN